MVETDMSSKDTGFFFFGDLKPKKQYFCIFVPSKTRDEEAFDHEYWRKETIRFMSGLFGGATTLRGFGGWLDDEQGGKIKEEEISLIFSFIAEEELSAETYAKLNQFLQRLGRETRQGEIGCYTGGVFYRIRNFGNGRQFE